MSQQQDQVTLMEQQNHQKNVNAWIKLMNEANSSDVFSPSNEKSLAKVPRSIMSNHNHNSGSESNTIQIPWRLLLLLLVFILILFTYFDIKSEYTELYHESEIRNRECYKNYHQNSCDDPVEILEESCRQWRQCYHRKPTVKFTVAFTNVIASMIRNTIQRLGYLCFIFIMLALALFTFKSTPHTKIN